MSAIDGSQAKQHVGRVVRGVRLLFAMLGVASLFFAAPAVGKAPPAHAYYGATDIDCFVGTDGTTIGAKVDAVIGVRPKKNNALRRLEIKYRLVYADTSAGLGWSKPGYKVSKSATKKWSDRIHWSMKRWNLSTNREMLGGDYHVEMQFVWVRAGARPNWKVKKLYKFDESPCNSYLGM